MKKLLSLQQNSNTLDIVLLITRVAIAALMLTHGIPKMIMLFSGEPVKFISIMGMSAKLSLGLAVFAEVFCSVLLLLGLATRFATIPLMITMLVAVFFIQAGAPFAEKELAVHYLLAYTVLLIAGSGKYSVDYLLQRKRSAAKSISITGEDPTLSFYK